MITISDMIFDGMGGEKQNFSTFVKVDFPEGREYTGGVFDVSDLEVLCIEGTLQSKLPNPEEVKAAKCNLARFEAKGESYIKLSEFISKYKKTFCFAHAYEKYDMFFLSDKPKSITKQKLGEGFEGHGTAVVLEFTKPVSKLLILGQND